MSGDEDAWVQVVSTGILFLLYGTGYYVQEAQLGCRQVFILRIVILILHIYSLPMMLVFSVMWL